LLRTLNPEELKSATGDIFGRIYEYFLTGFADLKAHGGGEFFTPVSLVQLITNVDEVDEEKIKSDVEGLVKLVSMEELESNDWSLTPGRYVGVDESIKTEKLGVSERPQSPYDISKINFDRLRQEFTNSKSKRTTRLAFINADWRDFQNKPAIEEKYKGGILIDDYLDILKRTDSKCSNFTGLTF